MEAVWSGFIFPSQIKLRIYWDLSHFESIDHIQSNPSQSVSAGCRKSMDLVFEIFSLDIGICRKLSIKNTETDDVQMSIEKSIIGN